MNRVFIDSHMFSSEWFIKILGELVSSKKVVFLFSNCEKGGQELARQRKALEFKKAMMRIRRACEGEAGDVERHVKLLKSNPHYCSCEACDDPHIMAAIYIHPAKYVFTNDARLAKCRDKMSSFIDKRYRDFIAIVREDVYLRHRLRII